MPQIIDEMPTLTQVEQADPAQLAQWYFYLRPIMSNDEMVVVKTVARRFDALPDETRQRAQAAALRGRQ